MLIKICLLHRQSAISVVMMNSNVNDKYGSRNVFLTIVSYLLTHAVQTFWEVPFFFLFT